MLEPTTDDGDPRLGDSRNHLLEVPQRWFDFGAGGHIVLHLVDERRVWDASWVGGGIFTPVYDLLSAVSGHGSCFFLSGCGLLYYPGATFFPLSAMLTMFGAGHCAEVNFPRVLQLEDGGLVQELTTWGGSLMVGQLTGSASLQLSVPLCV